MVSITFVTAVASYHTDLLPLAIKSVQQQTVKCEHVIIYDNQLIGAGWARNQGLAKVTTDFIIFLDSDDTVDPTFAEKTLAAFDGYHYVYTDFIHNNEIIQTPDKGHFVDGNNQVITCLIPTIWARKVGGFDESLQGAEDTKFYLALQATRRCGKRLAEPLFNYGKAGRRARDFVHGGTFESVMSEMKELRGVAMACCGEIPGLPPLIEPQPGDVLAEAMWMGNRNVYGHATERPYGRVGNHMVVSVHPDDVKAAPHLWRQVVVVSMPEKFVPSEPTFTVGKPLTSVDEAAAAFFGISPNRVQTAEELRAIQPAKVQPDVKRVQELIHPLKNKGGRPRKAQ